MNFLAVCLVRIVAIIGAVLLIIKGHPVFGGLMMLGSFCTLEDPEEYEKEEKQMYRYREHWAPETYPEHPYMEEK